MPLPSESSQELRTDLTDNKLLAPELIDETLTALNSDEPIRWNLLLSQQFEQEKGGENNEADA
ncbi:hypothetical protein [Roseibacillus persicicus]|uniref:hypothetical protein n=1 Tax=Roseibacillus persicicus TaxID=454148 RepID=UPI0028107BB4|nr:hypothetical protein [Roseibacillus persicicus]MDQ8188758.1 hypothetical protein [Roseibacillus persicicus]